MCKSVERLIGAKRLMHFFYGLSPQDKHKQVPVRGQRRVVLVVRTPPAQGMVLQTNTSPVIWELTQGRYKAHTVDLDKMESTHKMDELIQWLQWVATQPRDPLFCVTQRGAYWASRLGNIQVSCMAKDPAESVTGTDIKILLLPVRQQLGLEAILPRMPATNPDSVSSINILLWNHYNKSFYLFSEQKEPAFVKRKDPDPDPDLDQKTLEPDVLVIFGCKPDLLSEATTKSKRKEKDPFLKGEALEKNGYLFAVLPLWNHSQPPFTQAEIRMVQWTSLFHFVRTSEGPTKIEMQERQPAGATDLLNGICIGIRSGSNLHSFEPTPIHVRYMGEFYGNKHVRSSLTLSFGPKPFTTLEWVTTGYRPENGRQGYPKWDTIKSIAGDLDHPGKGYKLAKPVFHSVCFWYKWFFPGSREQTGQRLETSGNIVLDRFLPDDARKDMKDKDSGDTYAVPHADLCTIDPTLLLRRTTLPLVTTASPTSAPHWYVYEALRTRGRDVNVYPSLVKQVTQIDDFTKYSVLHPFLPFHQRGGVDGYSYPALVELLAPGPRPSHLLPMS
jgi:hypothetical protein